MNHICHLGIHTQARHLEAISLTLKGKCNLRIGQITFLPGQLHWGGVQMPQLSLITTSDSAPTNLCLNKEGRRKRWREEMESRASLFYLQDTDSCTRGQGKRLLPPSPCWNQVGREKWSTLILPLTSYATCLLILPAGLLKKKSLEPPVHFKEAPAQKTGKEMV